MPATARHYRVSNVFDPAQSINAGARHLRHAAGYVRAIVFWSLLLYNAGSGAVKRYGGVPPYAETQAYVRKVMQPMVALPHRNGHRLILGSKDAQSVARPWPTD